MTTKTLPGAEGFKFGCDPELFVLDANGTPVSAHGLFPGTKENPHKVEFGAIQVDGMAAEFNIDPVTNFDDFDRNITEVLKQLKDFLPKGYSLSAVPAIEFSKEVFDAAPDEAKELGCTPDFNAWTCSTNPPPCTDSNPYLRTASGHLHIGWRDTGDFSEPAHVLHCNDLVKQLDWYLGAWSLTKDEDARRRILYGKAGACRYKDYGVEYRVLSNFWITNKSLRRETWNRMQTAIVDMRDRFIPDKLRGTAYNDQLVRAIDTSVVTEKFQQTFRFPMRTLDASFSRV